MKATHNRWNDMMMRHTQMIKNLTGILVVFLVFAIVSFFNGITMMKGDAAFINDMGKIRGNAQRIVKQEIMGYPNATLIAYVDEIVHHVRTNHQSGLMSQVNFMEAYMALEVSWDELQKTILETRLTGDKQLLYEQSERFFQLSDQVVARSQAYAESKMDYALSYRPVLIAAIGILVIVYVFLLLYSLRLTKRYSQMQIMAVHDSLTGLFNRNFFNQTMNSYSALPQLPDLICVFFDLNNLKITNDMLGHDAGNLLLEQFSKLVRVVFEGHGEIFRYGGDEFIVLLTPSEDTVETLVEQLHERVLEWNKQSNTVMISFAYGVSYSHEPEIKTMEDLIAIADVRMYENKLSVKQSEICCTIPVH